MGKDFQDSGGKSLSLDNCEVAARMIRERAGVNEEEPLPPILGVLSRLGFECIIRSDSEMDDREAFAVPAQHEIYFKQNVYERILDDEPTARFVAMHEVAHGFCHEGNAPFFKMTGGNVLLPFLSGDDSIEVQADRISRASLMPKSMVQEFQTARELAAFARAPFDEAVTRKLELNIRSARTTPPSVLAEIERQRAIANEGRGCRRSQSVLDPAVAARLAWELAPLAAGMPSDEYRSVDGRYIIRWSRHEKMMPGGWRVSGGNIVPWESETSS